MEFALTVAGIVIGLFSLGAGLYTYIWNKTWEAFERGYSEGYKDGQENRK
jgi:hypothetical protein